MVKRHNGLTLRMELTMLCGQHEVAKVGRVVRVRCSLCRCFCVCGTVMVIIVMITVWWTSYIQSTLAKKGGGQL